MLAIRVLLPFLAVSLGLSACQQGERAPPGTEPGPALWQVTDEDTTIYLFGTAHVLPRDTDWFDSRIERALDAADELLTEVAPSDARGSAVAIRAAALLPEGQSLRDMMTEENRNEYEAALASFDMPADALDRLEPWAAAANLSQQPLIRAGYNVESGAENVLIAEAKAGTTFGGLETLDEQVALSEEPTIEAQLARLDLTVEALAYGTGGFDNMVATWLSGDTEKMAALVNAGFSDSELDARFRTQRNAKWAEWIERRMADPGTVFIAVGFGHLAGDGSVQEYLRARGLKVERIWR